MRLSSIINVLGKWALIIFITIIIVRGVSQGRLRVQMSALEGRIDKLNLELFELRTEFEAFKFNQILNGREQLMEDKDDGSSI